MIELPEPSSMSVTGPGSGTGELHEMVDLDLRPQQDRFVLIHGFTCLQTEIGRFPEC